MKRQLMTIGAALLFVIGSSTFVGCGGGEDHSGGDGYEHAEGEEHEHEADEHAHYICPMDCEDGKTYEEPGLCPKCEMDLEEV